MNVFNTSTALHSVSQGKAPASHLFQKACRYREIMSDSVGKNTEKKVLKIDISADTVCHWSYLGKRNLDKAIAASKDQYDFQVRWHPLLLESLSYRRRYDKKTYYRIEFGCHMEARLAELLRSHGLDFNLSGFTGNSLERHRLLYFAAHQGLDKQHNLMEELFFGYFTQAKFIGDREFLMESAKKVGIEGATEFLEDPNNGLKEVKEEIRKYSGNNKASPYFVINGIQKVKGAETPEVLLRAFEAAANSENLTCYI